MSGGGGSVHSSLMSETQRSLASLESMMSGSRQMKAESHVQRGLVSAPLRVQHFLRCYFELSSLFLQQWTLRSACKSTDLLHADPELCQTCSPAGHRPLTRCS